MKIPYALRSKFTNACKESIVAQQEALSAGQTIHILLEAKGYPGKIKVTVYPGNLIEFGAD